mmetsp:Transcript_4084/g.4730  ORF Transcript_4084/g.4730 Transcript_4084/m.4730 type:complete len:503 (-) Transcript_4084:64-1572(-)|eukprot:CAMPEP_0184015724 /NCGR_PEP_ID=MMETSP0954-20121128/6502_1 /TAXON_ID=627963 /ORGANISM="Aplanochytrium sp, Strain PBS07" /LENGTH=502 /DNA_ID=CAMNT_0026296605 /DNA_START=373 /DNA_END=1881 /DNA_ORIENTATION=-
MVSTVFEAKVSEETKTVSERPQHVENALRFIHTLEYKDIPEEVRREARRALLDLVGCGIGAQQTKLSKIAKDYCSSMYGGKGGHLWCEPDMEEVSVIGAALSNALQVDALDIHDSAHNAKGHAGVALVPAAVLMSKPLKDISGIEHLRDRKVDLDFDHPLTGEEFLTYLVIGYEIAYRAGETLITTATDYHSSGAWNALGCAAMWCRRLKLTYEETLHAMGIAEYYGPRSPVMRVMDNPTMLKDGSGVGCWAGVSGAVLASKGFTGAPAALFAPDEFSALWNSLCTEWHLCIYHVYKKHPTCYWAQGAINGVLKVREKLVALGVDMTTVKELRVSTFPEACHLFQTQPKTTEEAQYSIAFASACALLKGFVDVSEDEGINDIEVRRLVERTKIEIHDSFKEQKEHATAVHDNCADVDVTLEDGCRIASGMSFVEWDKFRNMKEPTNEELQHKFLFLSQLVGADMSEAKKISEMCLNLESLQDSSEIERAVCSLRIKSKKSKN